MLKLKLRRSHGVRRSYGLRRSRGKQIGFKALKRFSSKLLKPFCRACEPSLNVFYDIF